MEPENPKESLILLHTNDLHSHFGAMVRLFSMINEEKSKAGDSSILLLDIGDHMDRAAVETEGTLGKCNVDVLNAFGYDAITIGNNEGLTFTPENLAEAYSDLHSPVVCCNIIERATGRPPSWAREHLILDKGGFTIGIVGATVAFSDFYELQGWDALDPIPAIEKQVSRLRDKVELVIVMSHLGFKTDQELAARVKGIDLILGGHSHHLLETPLFIGDTAIAAAEKYGHYLGKIEIVRDPKTGRPKVDHGICMPVEEGTLDISLDKIISDHRRIAEEQLSQTVAITERSLTIDYESESPFGNLLAQSVRKFTGTEIALVNSGQLLSNLPAGKVSAGMLHALCPSPINPCRIRLTGSDIIYSLEESLIPETCRKPIYGYGFRGKVLGCLCIDGLQVLYDPSRIAYDRIIRASVGGVLLELDQEYDVGTLDMFMFGIGYERLQSGTEREFILPEFLRDLLRLELQDLGAVEECLKPRWRALPQASVQF